MEHTDTEVVSVFGDNHGCCERGKGCLLAEHSTFRKILNWRGEKEGEKAELDFFLKPVSVCAAA